MGRIVRSHSKGYRLTDIVNTASAIVSLLFMIIPFFQGLTLGRTYSLVMMLSMGTWFLTTLSYSTRWIIKINKGMLGLLGLLAFYAIVLMIGEGNIRTHAVTILAPYYGFLVFYFYYSTNQNRTLSLIVKIVLAGLCITFLTTLLAEDQYAYREIKNIDMIIQSNYLKNIGTTHHIYSGALVGTVLFSFILAGDIVKNNSLILKMIGVISFYLAITSSSAIAVVCAFIAIGGLLIQRSNSVFRYVLVPCILLMIFLLRAPIGEAIQNIGLSMDNKYMSKKLYDMGASIASGESTGELAGRTRLWMQDLNTFTDSYFMGIGSYYLGAGNGTHSIADHSQLFSDMARYGIVFTVYIIFLFSMYIKLLNSMLRRYELQCNLNVYYFVFALMYVCQPVFTNFVIPTVFLFLIPGIVVMIGERKKLSRDL